MRTAANRLPGDELAGRRRARTAAGRRPNESGTDLVGRDAELAIGFELVDRLRNGRGGVVVVEGEAGAGKSRVVQAWVENAVAGGLEVAEGSCLELDGVRPFGALARALRLGNEGAGEWGGGRFAVIDGIADLVEERAPLVLVLEDVHWADPATLLALHRLVPRCGQTGLLIVLTSRPVPSDSELVSVLALVERLGGSRLPLRPLGAGDAVILAGNIAGARPGPRLMARLDTAAGNPFYVIELVSVLVAEGAVSVVKGVAEVEEDSTPAPLRAAIVRHLRFLSPATMEVLQIAAVLGSSFAVADLAVVLACPPSRLLTVLREATDTGVLVERGDRLGFRHALVRDVVYEDLSVSMRRALHLQVADHLASEASPAAAVVVATHYRLGADPGLARAVDWVSRAAAEVGPRDAHLGAELIGQVLELLAPRDGRRAGLLAEQARLFAFAGRYAESEASARAALDLAPPPDVEWLAAGVFAMGLGMTGRSAEAIRLLEGLALRASELQQAQIIGLLSMQRLAVGDVAGAHADAVATVEAGRRLGNSELVALGSARACWAAYFRGELEEAVVHGERAVATTVESSQMGPENAAPGHQGLAVALMDSDRMDEARAVLVAHRQGVGIAGGPYNLQVTYYLLGAHGWVTGAWLDGVAEIDSGVALADEVGNAFGRPTGLSFAAIIAAHRGDRDALDGLLTRLAADEGAGVYQAADWWLALWARGTAAVLDGRADDGLGYLRSAWTIVTTVQAVSQFRLLGPTSRGHLPRPASRPRPGTSRRTCRSPPNGRRMCPAPWAPRGGAAAWPMPTPAPC